MKNKLIACALVAFAYGMVSVAKAALTPVNIWTGNVGLSIDAVGSNNDPVGNIQAQIPVGATVLAAYLYSAGTPYPWYSASPTNVAAYNSSGITLAGTAVTNFSAIVGASALPSRPDIGNWYTGRADVTALIQSLATGGPSYSWAVTEGTLNNYIDGEVLAVVYQQASLPTSSVVLLDGGQNTGGETTTVNFGSPLSNVSDPGFVADMSLAISFSTGDSQHSLVDVNGTRLTTAAGGYDDGTLQDGGLITAGGVGDSNANPADPYSTASGQDDELYSLVPFLTTGDTGFSIFTQNPSNDDNIFMMGLHITADVTTVNPGVPDESATALLLAISALAFVAVRRRLAAR